ncbi:ExbD/TolR family protein [Tundrisphaera sp. TA3]|uniref:ExbD/TolR family protein n=1 Tax=Tundrisphaera sp. TA3 TaxID=3435775 RepID=UPI003EBE288C
MGYRNRVRGKETLELNLTPLLDVVLQLITFFMMLIHFGNQVEGESASIKLPSAPAALPAGDLALDRLIVNIDARGHLLDERADIDAKTSGDWWAEQARRRKAGMEALGEGGGELSTVVVVRADKATTYGAVRGLLASAQANGFARFSLVVLQGDAR